jgi:hypothetical protein
VTFLIRVLIELLPNIIPWEWSFPTAYRPSLKLNKQREKIKETNTVGTCSPGQVDPTGKWNEYLQSSTWDGKSFVDLPL